MARIVLGSYLVRFPLGGYLSWVIQWLAGFQRLGHEVYFVEKAGWPNACFNPVTGLMSDDCSYGTRIVHEHLSKFGLQDCWCFVDNGGVYHGLTRARIEDVFKTADLFVEMGTHGTWMDEAAAAGLRVLIDGEPAATQMKWEKLLAAGKPVPQYDFYYSVGRNIGTAKSSAPTAGKQWHAVSYPVNVDWYSARPLNGDRAFTTVMSWQAHEPIEFQGKTYGRKDVEFPKFMDLPRLAKVPLEVAIAGGDVPYDELKQHGWRVRNAHAETLSMAAFNDYIRASQGEFSVCKNVFVATNSGWFSDRSAVYLASGRPVVMQETGFSDHFPCGKGLFAVRTAEEAAAAFEEIVADYQIQSKCARKIATEYLDTSKVLGRFLRELGVS